MRKVLRQFRRPRWLVTTTCLAVGVPAILLASGVAAGGPTPGANATPVVNRDYMYGQLFSLAYNNVYRISGADGDPTESERSIQRRPDAQRLAGVLPAVEVGAHEREVDDETREVRDGLRPLLPADARATDERELHIRPLVSLEVG